MTAGPPQADPEGASSGEPPASTSEPGGETPAERLVLRVLARLHREQPLSAGFRSDAVVARVLAEADGPRPPSSHRGGRAVRMDAAAVEDSLASLTARGKVERAGRRVALHGAGPELDPETRRRAEGLLEALRRFGMRPPPIRTLARDAGLSERVLEFLRERDELITVAPEIDFVPEALSAAERAFRDLAAAEGGVRAARFRDVIGTGRRHAVALLEYFDSIGVSRREGETHLVARGPSDGGGSAGSDDAADEHDTRGVS